jgi:hypothetical protein
MSMLLVTPASVTVPFLKYRACDYRASESIDQPESEHEELTDTLWPRSRFMSGAGPFTADNLCAPVWIEYPAHESAGARSCYVIEGYTQDADGNPLDGCKVQAFTTADKEFQEECNSNSGGFYRLGVYVQGPYFLLAHRSGAPDLGGASNDDVMPT